MKQYPGTVHIATSKCYHFNGTGLPMAFSLAGLSASAPSRCALDDGETRKIQTPRSANLGCRTSFRLRGGREVLMRTEHVPRLVTGHLHTLVAMFGRHDSQAK